MSQKRYRLVNSLVLLLTFAWIVEMYLARRTELSEISVEVFLVLAATSALVLTIKAVRLYFALFDRKITVRQHMKQYCKVIPVSMIFPFKMGDIFRMYCYGYQIEDYFGGVVIILLDRIMDTFALLTVQFIMHVVLGSGLSLFFYVLLTFLLCAVAGYLVFPGMCSYWKNYLLERKATRQGLRLLSALSKCSDAYTAVSVLIQGRCMILYLLSLLAWGIEIGGIMSISKSGDKVPAADTVFRYLNSALTGSSSVYLTWFIIISSVFMLATYLVLYLIQFAGEGGGGRK